MRDPNDRSWQMPADVQFITLLIAITVVVVIFIGMRALWLDWRESWGIEDYIEGCIAENGEVMQVEDDHPMDMPRRPKRLGRLGWCDLRGR